MGGASDEAPPSLSPPVFAAVVVFFFFFVVFGDLLLVSIPPKMSSVLPNRSSSGLTLAFVAPPGFAFFAFFLSSENTSSTLRE